MNNKNVEKSCFVVYGNKNMGNCFSVVYGQ